MNTEVNKLPRKECIKFIRENYKTKTIEEIAIILGRKNHYVKTIMDKCRLKPKKSLYICKPKPVKKHKKSIELTKKQKEYIHKHYKTKPILHIAKELGTYHSKIAKYYRLKNIPIIFARKRYYKNKELTKEQKEYIHKYYKTKPIIYIAKEIGTHPVKVTKYYHLKNIPIIFAKKRYYKDKETDSNKYSFTHAERLMMQQNRKLKEEKKKYTKKLLQKISTPNFKSELEKNLYEINKSNNEGYEFGK